MSCYEMYDFQAVITLDVKEFINLSRCLGLQYVIIFHETDQLKILSSQRTSGILTLKIIEIIEM